MELVIDTNIVVSAILKSGITRNMIFNQGLTLCSPEHLLIELQKHEAEFMKKSGLNKEQLATATSLVLSNIEISLFEEYSSSQVEAKQITPDPDDWPFLALALKKQVNMWSNDARLKQQDKIKVLSTPELIQELQHH